MTESLVLIPGISGKMGTEYGARFKELGNFDIIGFSRSTNMSPNIIQADFLDKASISEAFMKIEFSKYKDVFLIHAIGPFLFEEHIDIDSVSLNNNQQIHKKTYNLNFYTFKNLFEELKIILPKQTTLSIIAFGSISDRYNIPWWYTYSKAKNNLRNYMRCQISNQIRGLFINVSSTEKDDERPFADKEYWMSCKEVSCRTMRAVLDKELNWQEIDIFKPYPKFNYNYFENLELIKTKWLKDMYG